MPHIHEKVDFAVEVFIVYKNTVLLRMHDKFNTWLSVGGHIELDEDPMEAAIREVKEEVGLEVELVGTKAPLEDEKDEVDYKHLIGPRFLGSHQVNKNHKHVIFVYFAKAKSDVVSESISGHERTETKWVTKEELKDMNLFPNVLYYAEEALKKLGEK